MTKKTKAIIFSIIGIIIIVPIIIVAIAIVSLYLKKTSTSSIAQSPSYALKNSKISEDEMFGSATETNDLDRETSQEMAFSDLETPIQITATAGETAAEVDQKIIKTGRLNLTVDAVDEVTTKTSALASNKGGYTQNSSVSERKNGSKFGTIIIRVPAAEFENTMTEIKQMATAINTETTDGQDVTEEYTDLESQLKNAQAQEVEYLKILNKAESVSEILKVQSYLGKIRGEIESLQGRIKYLVNLTSYSTITVSLSEEPIVKLSTKEFRPWTSIKEAAQTLVVVAQNLIVTLIWLVILGGGIFLPIIIVFAIVIFIIRKTWRHYKNKI